MTTFTLTFKSNVFHEFGHVLHFFSSDVRYPTLHNGVRDYTEFQSQLLERWLFTDKIIDQFLVHQKTGEPLSLQRHIDYLEEEMQKLML